MQSPKEVGEHGALRIGQSAAGLTGRNLVRACVRGRVRECTCSVCLSNLSVSGRSGWRGTAAAASPPSIHPSIHPHPADIPCCHRVSDSVSVAAPVASSGGRVVAQRWRATRQAASFLCLSPSVSFVSTTHDDDHHHPSRFTTAHAVLPRLSVCLPCLPRRGSHSVIPTAPTHA